MRTNATVKAKQPVQTTDCFTQIFFFIELLAAFRFFSMSHRRKTNG
jgi:hypothetical protein